MKNKKTNKEIDYKKFSKLYFITSLAWYAAAIFSYIGDNTGYGTLYTCLGCTWLCLGTIYLNKSKEDKRK